MATESFTLEIESRDVKGKGASRRLRRETNKVPGIIYGGEQKPQNIMVDHFALNKALSNEAFYSHILTLKGLKKDERVVLKALQRHPYKPTVQHMDFMRVSENKPITMHVPIHFTGQEEAPGVVNEGGVVTHHMTELEVKCLPKDLPEFIAIDLTNAALDTVVHLSQVALPKGVELTTVVHGADDDLPVVSIHKPKRVEVEEEVSAEAAAGEEGAEAATGEEGAADENASADSKDKDNK